MLKTWAMATSRRSCSGGVWQPMRRIWTPALASCSGEVVLPPGVIGSGTRTLPDGCGAVSRLRPGRFGVSEDVLREAGESESALKTLQDYTIRHADAGTWELLSLEGILEDEQGHFDVGAGEGAPRGARARSRTRARCITTLGYNLLLQGHAGEAAVEFRRAIEIDPHSTIAHNNLGTALAATPNEALAEMRRSTQPAVAHNNLAAVLIEQGHYAEARTELASALAFRRDFPEALANLKLVSERDGLPATVPLVRKAVNFRQRAASTWAKVIGEKSTGP